MIERYRLHNPEDLLTPALLVYPDVVRSNVRAMVAALGGDPLRWRPHVKTAKLPSVVRELGAAGVRAFKCATPLELRMLCDAGVPDALLANFVGPPGARLVRALADASPATSVSVLVDAPEQLELWRGSAVSVFLDVDAGFHRSGIPIGEPARLLSLATDVRNAGLAIAGLHAYEADVRLDLGALVLATASLLRGGHAVPEVVTTGTPGLEAALAFAPLMPGVRHTVSAGTVLFGDMRSVEQVPAAWGLAPAALVLSRVISCPRAAQTITADAGHKSVSADAGVPTCAVVGEPDLVPEAPNEEHLPIRAREGRLPPLGEHLYLLPRHICPTVNLHDQAVHVRDGEVVEIERITARGHDPPTGPSAR